MDQRLAALEAQVESLLDEVAFLRREVTRLRVDQGAAASSGPGSFSAVTSLLVGSRGDNTPVVANPDPQLPFASPGSTVTRAPQILHQVLLELFQALRAEILPGLSVRGSATRSLCGWCEPSTVSIVVRVAGIKFPCPRGSGLLLVIFKDEITTQLRSSLPSPLAVSW